MERSISAKSNNVREFDVYYRSKTTNEMTWCNSFTSLFKDNKRAAKYYAKKMKEKYDYFDFIVIERE